MGLALVVESRVALGPYRFSLRSRLSAIRNFAYQSWEDFERANDSRLELICLIVALTLSITPEPRSKETAKGHKSRSAETEAPKLQRRASGRSKGAYKRDAPRHRKRCVTKRQGRTVYLPRIQSNVASQLRSKATLAPSRTCSHVCFQTKTLYARFRRPFARNQLA